MREREDVAEAGKVEVGEAKMNGRVKEVLWILVIKASCRSSFEEEGTKDLDPLCRGRR
jgi:hypothetical protein